MQQGLTKREVATLAAQLDAVEARIRAAVGAGDSPLAPPAQPEPRDDAEIAEQEIAQRQDDAMLEHYRMQLADIGAARLRMSSGTYGVCIDCRQAIPFERLQASPTAKRCTACQRHHEHLYARQAQEASGNAPG
ncbi:TraR/DksA C4-type zinc finger protein [Cupriavidus sp. WKF15]|nr:TraR/DksA C4-type zinc finger protein [Cupriavidus sp. WKF15]WER50382.1 TraR/DksA C4-type zinc finger protein [Cupriavidus sp. WKF15]